MAQSNHSVEINVTANAEKAKKELQEIEALLNKLNKGANLGLGGGGRRGGGSGGAGTGGAGSEEEKRRTKTHAEEEKRRTRASAEEEKRRTEETKAENKRLGDIRKSTLISLTAQEKRFTEIVKEEEKRRTEAAKAEARILVEEYKTQQGLISAALKTATTERMEEAKRETEAAKEEGRRLVDFRKATLISLAEQEKRHTEAAKEAGKQRTEVVKGAIKQREQAEKAHNESTLQRQKTSDQVLLQQQKTKDQSTLQRQKTSDQVLLQQQKTKDQSTLQRQKTSDQVLLQQQKTASAQQLQEDKDYYATKADFRRRDLQDNKAAQDRYTADYRDRLGRQRELDREARAEQRRQARQDDQDQRQAARKAEQEELRQEREKQRRRRRGFRRLGRFAEGTTLTGMGVAGAGDVSQGIGAFGQGLGSIPLLGSVLGAGVDTLVSGIQARLGLQRGLASIQPAAVTARALVPGVGGLGQQLEGARGLAEDLGVGPSQFFQRQAAIAGGTGRGVGPNALRRLVEQSFEEQFLGVDPSSLASFLRQGSLGRAAGRRGQVQTELGRIESFRQQQGLLPAELTMLRQAGLGFRQQGLAQGFDIQESSLFGLTKGIMGGARSGAGRSLTGAMGLAQRERQLGVGAFQSFAGQFADLPNTLLLAQAAQQGGGVGDILSRLSRLGQRPGASAAALRSAGGQFGIPREILQAGISAQLGLGFEAGGDVLEARKRRLGTPDLVLPEIDSAIEDPALGLARAFAGGEVSRLEAGIRFQGETQLTGLLEANVTMQSSLASMNEDQLPQLIQSVANVQETITPLVEAMNREISGLATKISEALR